MSALLEQTSGSMELANLAVLRRLCGCFKFKCIDYFNSLLTYKFTSSRQQPQQFIESVRGFSGKQIFARLLDGTYKTASWTSRKIQHGYLRKYIRSVFLFLILLLIIPCFQAFKYLAAGYCRY